MAAPRSTLIGMSTNTSWRSIENRLGAAGQAVDTIVARVRASGLNGLMSRWVDALRAHEAELRTRLRELREAGPDAGETCAAALDRDLDRLATSTAVTAARLDTELAADRHAFAAAVGAELAARYAQIEDLTAVAGAIDALKAGVRRAMAELDDAAAEAALSNNDRRRSR